MKNEIVQRVLEIVSKVFNVDKNSISLTTSKDDLDNWDSIGHLQLIMNLESEFGIKFKTKEIMNLKDIQGIINAINILLISK